MLLMGVYALKTFSTYRVYQLWRPMEWPHLPTLLSFLRLGVPAGLSIMVEITSFTLMALFIARMGVAASAGHQIAATAAGVLYMMPLALGIASSSRVGYWQGAQRPDQVRHAIAVGLSLSAGLAVFCGSALWLGKSNLAHLFTSDPEVAVVAVGLLSWVSFYHVMDGIQTSCAFLLRCFQITLLPLVIYSLLLWGIGLGGGYLWAYHGLAAWPAQPVASTFWFAATLALCGVAVLFLAMTYRVSHRLQCPHA
jgi:MATE family multidrug resistance protein